MNNKKTRGDGPTIDATCLCADWPLDLSRVSPVFGTLAGPKRQAQLATPVTFRYSQEPNKNADSQGLALLQEHENMDPKADGCNRFTPVPASARLSPYLGTSTLLEPHVVSTPSVGCISQYWAVQLSFG